MQYRPCPVCGKRQWLEVKKQCSNCDLDDFMAELTEEITQPKSLTITVDGETWARLLAKAKGLESTPEQLAARIVAEAVRSKVHNRHVPLS